MIRTRHPLVLIGVVLALALGAAWFVSRTKPTAGTSVDPVAPELDARAETASIELASVPDLPDDASRAPARTSAKTSKTDWAARPHAVVYSLSGSVVDDRGVAVASFVIRAEPAGEDVEGRRYATDKFHDPSGAYQLANVMDGEWSVFATDDLGLASAPRNIVLPRDARLPVDFVLPRSASISGRVLDLDGTPAKSAHVEVFRVVDKVEQSLRSVSTEVDGSFRLSGVLAAPLKLIARRDDRASNWIELAPRPGDALEGVVVTLLPGGTIEGRLHDADQNPRASVRVELSLARASAKRRDALTAGDGTFRFEGVEPGPVTVSAPMPAGGTGVLSANSVAEAGRITYVDLGSGPPAPILVRGVIRASGPLAGTEVEFATGSDPRERLDRMTRTRADSSGKYAVRLAVGGMYAVVVSVRGRATLHTSVQVTDAAEQVIDIELGTGRIAGRVLTQDGAPVGDAMVIVRPGAVDVERHGTSRSDVLTASDGTFEVLALMPGTYSVRAVSDGVKSNRFEMLTGGVDSFALADGQDRDGIEIRLANGQSSLRVLVLGPDGKPAQDCLVRILGEEGSGQPTDRDGIARLSLPRSGEIAIGARNESEIEAVPVRVVAIAGQRVDATLRLIAGGTLVVGLERRDGTPVLDPISWPVSVTDAAGRNLAVDYAVTRAPRVQRLLYTPVRPGSYTVRARFGQRIVEAHATVTAGDEREVVLREPD